MSNYDPETYNSGRRAANERSKNHASHHGEEWTAEEDEFIWSDWINVPACERDEEGVAFVVERTIEACRNRAHYLKYGVARGVRKRTTTRTVTETTTEYIGHYDDPEEVWWR